jgi:hypothetical protein
LTAGPKSCHGLLVSQVALLFGNRSQGVQKQNISIEQNNLLIFAGQGSTGWDKTRNAGEKGFNSRNAGNALWNHALFYWNITQAHDYSTNAMTETLDREIWKAKAHWGSW